jgi:hypothetical protein
MKTIIALAILCSAATSARADDCKATGSPVFTVEAVDAGKVKSTTKLFDTGAWTVDTSSGCDKAVIGKVKALVAKSPWKISHPVHCMMMTTTWTNYYAAGKLVFSERACNPDKLDDVSEKNLAEIVKLVTDATAASSCKAEGEVLFEMAKKANAPAKVETTTTRVYSTGAWTTEGREADGSPGPTRSGCFDKTVLARLVDDVKAPWTVTIPRVRCMARSQTYVEYSVRGKLVFQQQVCGKALDQESSTKLADIEAILTKR